MEPALEAVPSAEELVLGIDAAASRAAFADADAAAFVLRGGKSECVCIK